MKSLATRTAVCKSAWNFFHSSVSRTWFSCISAFSFSSSLHLFSNWFDLLMKKSNLFLYNNFDIKFRINEYWWIQVKCSLYVKSSNFFSWKTSLFFTIEFSSRLASASWAYLQVVCAFSFMTSSSLSSNSLICFLNSSRSSENLFC